MIPSQHAHLYVSATTHPGMKGKNNEDRYAVSAHLAGPDQKTPSLFAVVSDGIGGHRAGEVAAEIAVEKICRVIEGSDASEPTTILQEAILLANQEIYKQAKDHPEQKGMGATCACAWILGEQLYTASVGDSRIYLLRGETIQQLTIDHTWVQEAMENGVLTQQEARNHPNAHVIRRYLGSPAPVLPDLRLRLSSGESDPRSEANQGMRLLPGDSLLICSDGLTDLVEAKEIQAILKSNGLDDALHNLVALANRRGGHDNITMIALEVPQPLARPVYAMPKKKRSWIPVAVAFTVFAGVVLVALLALGGLALIVSEPTPTGTMALTPILLTPTTLPLVPTLAPDMALTATMLAQPTLMTPIPPTSLPGRSTYTPWPTSTRSP